MALPCGAWLLSPVVCALTQVQWAYIVEAYNKKVIKIEVVWHWCQLCFSAIAPTWVWHDMSLKNRDHIWTDLKVMMSNQPRLFPVAERAGRVIYSSEVMVGKDESSLLSKLDAVVTRASCGMYKSGDADIIERLYPCTSKMLRSRLVVDARLILKMLSSGRAVTAKVWCRVFRALLGLGIHCLGNWVLAIKATEEHLEIFDCLYSRYIFSCGIKYYTDITAEINKVIRQTGILKCTPIGLDSAGSWHHGLYLNVLVGRFDFPQLTHFDDVKHRATVTRSQRVFKDGVWSEENFTEVLDSVLDEVSAAYKSGKERLKTLNREDVHSRLRAMGTKGSASSLRKIKIDVGGEVLALDSPTKTAKLETLRVKDLAEVLSARPSNYTTELTKYENGKIRLLLAGDEQHWLVESLALYGGENRVYQAIETITLGKTGLNELYDYTLRLAGCVSSNANVASDFRDHNYLHTVDNMRKVWIRMAEAIDPSVTSHSEKWLSQDFSQFSAAACRWTAAALYSSYVETQDSEKQTEVVQSIQGLWSGWRSTTYLNTVFNEVYSRAVETSFANAYGRKALKRRHILGDDMDGESSSEWEGMRYLELLDPSGFDAVASKQLVSANRTEYLRVMYEDGTMTGSLNRAISGFSSGDAQTGAVFAGPERAVAVYDAMSTMVRRGAEYSNEFCWTLVEYWGTVVYKTNSGNRVRVPLPRVLAETAGLYGGLGLSDKLLRATDENSQPVKLPTRQAGYYPRKKLLEQLPGPLARAAVASADRMMQRVGYKLIGQQKLVNAHMDSAFISSLPLKVKTILRNSQAQRDAEWYNECASYALSSADYCVDSHAVRVLVGRSLADQATRAQNGVRFGHASNLQSAVDGALATALTTVAGLPNVLDHVSMPSAVGHNRSLSALQTVGVLGGGAADRALNPVVEVLGSKIVNKMLRGKLKLSAPVNRWVTSIHGALVWPCLKLVLSQINNLQSRKDPKLTNIVEQIDHIVRIAGDALRKHPFWGPQMKF
jgi:hypothetical protein